MFAPLAGLNVNATVRLLLLALQDYQALMVSSK
jgi:hypothetical protein